MAFKFSDNKVVYDITLIPEDFRIVYAETTGYYESYPEDDDGAPHNKWREWRIKDDMWPLIAKYEAMQTELKKLRQHKGEASHDSMRKGVEDRLDGRTRCKVFDQGRFTGEYMKQSASQ